MKILKQTTNSMFSTRRLLRKTIPYLNKSLHPWRHDLHSKTALRNATLNSPITLAEKSTSLKRESFAPLGGIHTERTAKYVVVSGVSPLWIGSKFYGRPMASMEMHVVSDTGPGKPSLFTRRVLCWFIQFVNKWISFFACVVLKVLLSVCYEKEG